jgi:hypothetical protein
MVCHPAADVNSPSGGNSLGTERNPVRTYAHQRPVANPEKDTPKGPSADNEHTYSVSIETPHRTGCSSIGEEEEAK